MDSHTIPYECTRNPIGTLQELAQVWKLSLPVYRECEGSYQEFGTEVTFTLGCKAGNPGETVVLNALGRTKKASKTKAAQKMLECISKRQPQLLQGPEPSPVSFPNVLSLVINLG